LQNRSFNRGIWSKLEAQVRQWAVDDKVVYVVTGTVLTKGLPAIGNSRITVPALFYKVIPDNTETDDSISKNNFLSPDARCITFLSTFGFVNNEG